MMTILSRIVARDMPLRSCVSVNASKSPCVKEYCTFCTEKTYKMSCVVSMRFACYGAQILAGKIRINKFAHRHAGIIQ